MGEALDHHIGEDRVSWEREDNSHRSGPTKVMP